MVKEIWYDRDGNLMRVDVNGRTVKTVIAGNEIVVTDEKGRETTKKFDEWDNLKRVGYPDGTSWEYEYDLRFNLPTLIVDGRKIVTKMRYDDRGNLEQKTEAVGTGVERTTKYAHDDDGNVLEIRRLADVRTAEEE